MQVVSCKLQVKKPSKTGLGSREENRQSVQGFKATEEVVRERFVEAPNSVIPNLFRDLVPRTNNLDA